MSETENSVAPAAEPATEDAALMAMVPRDAAIDPSANLAFIGLRATGFANSGYYPPGYFGSRMGFSVARLRVGLSLSEFFLVLLIVATLIQAQLLRVFRSPSFERLPLVLAAFFWGKSHQPRSSHTGVGLGAVAAVARRYRPVIVPLG